MLFYVILVKFVRTAAAPLLMMEHSASFSLAPEVLNKRNVTPRFGSRWIITQIRVQQVDTSIRLLSGLFLDTQPA